MSTQTQTTAQVSPETTSDATDQNTVATNQTGSDTQSAANSSEAQTEEKTFTQADLDRIVQQRLKAGIKAGIKAELAKLAGETGEQPTVEDLKRQLGDHQKTVSVYQAKEAVRDYMVDPANKLSVQPQNARAIEKLVMAEIEYDEEGKPANITEAFKSVQSLAPALFVNSTVSANANNGRNATTAPADMNTFIRQAAARK